jgi:hypothetical protein
MVRTVITPENTDIHLSIDTNMNMAVLETKRKEIFRMLLDVNDENILAEIEDILYGYNIPQEEEPCRYSPEALRATILQSREDAKNGRFVTMEHMRTKHPK